MEWQFICTRGRPHPIREYFIMYIEEGLLPQPWRKLTMVARNSPFSVDRGTVSLATQEKHFLSNKRAVS